jgi:cysteinyl-tRNA synthetase
MKTLSLTKEGPASELTAKLEQAKKELDAAFSNSFDTPTAMQVILRLVRDANIYMNDRSKSDTDLQTVEVATRWVTKIVGILGLDASARPPYDGLGWAPAGITATTDVDPKTAVHPYAAVFSMVKKEVQGLNLSEPSVQALLDQQSPDAEFAELEKSGERDLERLALPYVRAVSRLRDELRSIVLSASLEAKTKEAILMLSDRIRDYDLADLGVQLDDQLDRPSLLKFVPAARLIAAREEKAALAAEKARQKKEGMYFNFSDIYPMRPGRANYSRDISFTQSTQYTFGSESC